ncbi:MAG: hypothetical protein GPOALKHO_001479 [Sodalis sp.]|nr:MAG: hypothetical protein GPOALKHO_001479 [Sodalis sp.]
MMKTRMYRVTEAYAHATANNQFARIRTVARGNAWQISATWRACF